MAPPGMGRFFPPHSPVTSERLGSNPAARSRPSEGIGAFLSSPRVAARVPCQRSSMHRAFTLSSSERSNTYDAYVSCFLGSVSYFTHARRAQLYGLTESKAASGRMPDKCYRRSDPLRPASRRCARRTRRAAACEVALPRMDEEETWTTLIISGPTPGR